MDSLIAQIVADFKSKHQVDLADEAGWYRTERDLHTYLMAEIGRSMFDSIISTMDPGYQGPTIEHEGHTLKFVGYRTTELHGLFGMVRYRRAYYHGSQHGAGGYFPLDERLGIEKRHTPCCQYFLSSFTGREAYGKSLGRFQEVFRPDGKDLISQRKALDMDAELGERLERHRQEEIGQVFEEGKSVATREVVTGVMAVSVDATKLREKGEEKRSEEGKRSYEIAWKDVKVGAVSQVSWDKKREEAYCSHSSYVGGIEYADEFFKRVYVEMTRRSAALGGQMMVFVADGGAWIWDRLKDLANPNSVLILDYFHACEHVADLCKVLYGEQTPAFWDHFKEGKTLLFEGKVEPFLSELKELRTTTLTPGQREVLERELHYFEGHREHMHYDQYRAAHLPIGSGTIESACKNVIGGRMKQGGMTWSEQGADCMVQLRCSIESGRFLDDFLATLKAVA